MQTIVITGASDGIGAAAARRLAGGDVRLILVGRSPTKTRAVAAETGAEYHVSDFARLAHVRELAAAITSSTDRIDVLANNAGGMFAGPVPTEDGHEKTFQVNHLAPYLLTHLLLDGLLAAGGRVVNTSSIAARLYPRLDLDDLNGWRNYTDTRAYGNAKLANILFTAGLHEKFHGEGLSAVAFHPGMVATNFASHTDGYLHRVYHGALSRFLTSPTQGGERLVHFLEGRPGREWESGNYYARPGRIGRAHPVAYRPGTVQEHWRRSADMLGVRW